MGRDDDALLVNGGLDGGNESILKEENVTIGETKGCEMVVDGSREAVRMEGNGREASVLLSSRDCIVVDEDVSPSNDDDGTGPLDPLEEYCPPEGRDDPPVVEIGVDVV